MPRIAPEMTSEARRLRREQTAEERVIWARIRHVQPRFTRQLPIGRYVVDFACRSLRVAVELDGAQHLGAEHYDAQRTAHSVFGVAWLARPSVLERRGS
ncbi:DUF559 domain-containing protein [uncultured Brevundimonas sp.]|uniref:DUF559 domain-containing protein n=1 Tax=uncultured Brevundimonas sp. TaxID=213418 RepID=UPI0025DB0A12|nr:DUF559 domain-containing protein [uncultured Brevundimonas sp.]